MPETNTSAPLLSDSDTGRETRLKTPGPRQFFWGILGNEHRFWVLASILFGCLAAGRGYARANVWIATQAQVGYSQGFAKRALFAEILTKPLHLYSIGRYTAVSYMLMAVAFALLILFTIVARAGKRIGNGEVVAVFFASYCVTNFVHDVGYFDVLLLLLTVPLLLLRSDALRFWIGLPVSLAGLLLHEMFLLVFLPVVLFSFVLSREIAAAPHARRNATVCGVGLALCNVIATLLIAAQPTLSAGQVDALEAEVKTHALFPIRHDYFWVLNRSLGDNLRYMHSFYGSPVWWTQQVASLLLFGPTVWVLWLCIRRALRSVTLENRRVVLWSVAVACFAPLSMHLLGWDVVRWNGLIGFTGFLVLLTIRYGMPEARVAATPGLRNACILAIVFGLSSSGSLIFGNLYSFPFLNDPRILQKLHISPLYP